eukprot:jgi/Tetstr1/463995/TSEL_008800.t1
MSKAGSLESVKESVAKLNRDRARVRDLERQLKPYLDARRRVAAYFKANPGVGTVFDGDDEHYCSAIRNTQTRFNPELARHKLGEEAADCYEEKTIISVGIGVDQDAADEDLLLGTPSSA